MKLPPREIFNQVLAGMQRGREEYERDGKLLKSRSGDAKNIGYKLALDNLTVAGSTDAALYSGLLDKLTCAAIRQASSGVDQEALSKCFSDALSKLRFSADALNVVAMRQVGEFYEKGFGVQPSKLTAVDWLLKAAQIEIYKSNYSQAFEDVEKAMSLIPDHPKANKMRESILNAER